MKRDIKIQQSKKHHFAPVFYLSRWKDREWKICTIRNFDGDIKRRPRPPEMTGFEEHLYSYTEGSSVSDRAELETKFFKPLDNEGAKIVKKFMTGAELQHRERILWAQFLCAMRIRTPENVVKIKAHAAHLMLQEIEADQSKYEKCRLPDDPKRFIDFLADKPWLLENIGISQIANIASSPSVMADILRMNWYTVSLPPGLPLLTSDRPLMVTAGIQNPDCMFALPLSPECAFFAFYPGSRAQIVLMDARPDILAAALNRNVVSQAKERAYSQYATDAPDSFFRMHLAPCTSARQERKYSAT